MARTLLLVFIILFATVLVSGQAWGSAIDVVTVYSQNEQSYLKSVPFDNVFPTTPGRTLVYEKGNATPIYSFERGFDSVDDDSNNLVLSNDGEVIFYAIPWEANEEQEGLKSVSVYRHGELIKSFRETEINGCDKKRERCSLLYSNYDAVIDRDKSKFGTANYKKAFRDGVDETEKFLSNFPIFNDDDLVYLTDSKKILHVFDLNKLEWLHSVPFLRGFEQIKSKGRFVKTQLTAYDSSEFFDFPKLKNGQLAHQALAQLLDMKPVFESDADENQFTHYGFKIKASINNNGRLEIDQIEFWGGELPEDRVREFFEQTKFDRRKIPAVFEKWSFHDEYFTFRKTNKAVARRERQEELQEQREALARRVAEEMIDGVYIPKDLKECLSELDKLLQEVDKQEIKALEKREDMIQYHLGLGTWMRNNWRLWGGSRLRTYFTTRGINDPEEMSWVVLSHYYDWLHDKKETWQLWERNPKGH
jgi:hypothetical protein